MASLQFHFRNYSHWLPNISLHVVTLGNWFKFHSSTDAKHFFFSVRVINRWNSLSQAVDVNVFKNQLDRIRNSRMDGFLYGLMVHVGT